MAVEKLLKAVVKGQVLADTFSFGFHVQCASSYTDAGALMATLNAWDSNMTSEESPSGWTQLAALISTDAAYTELSLLYYESLPGDATFVANKTENHGGSSSTTGMLQQSLCVTLNTGMSGGSYRGRSYLPATGLVVGAGHVVNVAQLNIAALAITDCMGGLLDAVRAGDGGDGSRVCVYSPTKHITNEVTGLSIDNRMDVQRRRAEKQIGARTSYTGPNP